MTKRSKKGAHHYGRKVCIFCGETPVTGEHIWPDWARNLFPVSRYFEEWKTTGRRRSAVVSRQKERTRQGPVRNLKVHRVCHACNGIWMGGQEDRLKPILVRLFAGDPLLMTPEVFRDLTTYLTANLLVLDWIDGDALTTEEMCRDFRATLKAPPNFSLHIFNCFEGDWRSAYRSTKCALCRPENFVSVNAPQNTKSFALGLGNLFVFAIISTELDLDPEFERASAIRLFPNPPAANFWPPKFPIASDGAQFIARTLDRLLADPRVKGMD